MHLFGLWTMTSILRSWARGHCVHVARMQRKLKIISWCIRFTRIFVMIFKDRWIYLIRRNSFNNVLRYSIELMFESVLNYFFKSYHPLKIKDKESESTIHYSLSVYCMIYCLGVYVEEKRLGFGGITGSVVGAKASTFCSPCSQLGAIVNPRGLGHF